ncbi:hypothetical protein DXG01_016328 [Tephrocybe rancida]|nr:hypothetical protein DXG01_016328 [Tephrocybe rancida]
MSSPTPAQSFVGGIGLSLPVHALLLLNGNVFGISGFLHRAVLGGKESLCAIFGLILGGAYVGLLEGHATVTFFVTGVLTVQFLPGELPSSGYMDWSLGPNGKALIVTQVVISALLYSLATSTSSSSPKNEPPASSSYLASRFFVFLATGFEFALALRLSNISESMRVLSFLSLPFRPSFDPSLAFLAAGALPTSVVLYHFFRGSEKPLLGEHWSIPSGAPVDGKLIGGAALFGIGWGLAGICPGPGLVNLGRALSSGSGIVPVATWLSSVAIGGLLA